MTQDQSPLANYELRRRARSGQPPKGARSWKVRVAALGAALVVLVSGGVALFMSWSSGRVNLVQATVRAEDRAVVAEVDARLLELRVREGQKVSAGDTVAVLDDSEVRPLLEAALHDRDIKACALESAKAAAQLAEQRVRALQQRARADVRMAEAELARARMALELLRVRARAEVMRAQALLDAARADLKKLESGPREEEVEAARVRLEGEKARAALAELELRNSQQLVGEGIDSEYLLQVKKTELLTQQNKVREAELELSLLEKGPTEQELESARQGVAARQAELALAQARLTEVKDLEAQVEIRQRELEQAEAALAEAMARDAEVAMAHAGVKAAEAELAKAEATLRSRQAAVAKMRLKSPLSGTVLLTRGRPGEMCSKGQPIAIIADDSAGRWVAGYVHERDAGRVQPGQSATVRISDGRGSTVRAEVASVGLMASSASAAPAAGGGQGGRRAGGARYVEVKLKLERQDAHWLPGMSAGAVIHVR